jgi:hypothetical protein
MRLEEAVRFVRWTDFVEAADAESGEVAEEIKILRIG